MTEEHPPIPGRKTTAQQLQRSLRLLAAATAVLYLALGIIGLKIYFDGRATNKALCTFRADLSTRVLASTQFLQDNPEGVPGIPAKTLIDSISNQQRTIVALKDLDCAGLPEVEAVATPTTKPDRETP